MWLLLFMYMLLASTFTMGKAVLCFIKPILFIAIRMSIAGLILLSFVWFKARHQTSIKREDWWTFLQVILFHIYLSFTLEFWALERVTSAKAALIFNLSPFITALLAYFLIHERLTKKKWLGLCIGFSGLIPWIITQSPGEPHDVFFAFSRAELALLLAVIAASYGWILVKKLVHRDYSPIFINGLAMFTGGILAFITSAILEGTPSLVYATQVCPTDAPGLLFFASKYGLYWAQIILIVVYTVLLILLANVIFYNLYGYLLRKYSATFLSFAGFTCPIFAAIFGWLYLGETIMLGFVISLIIVSFGLYLFYQEELIQQ